MAEARELKGTLTRLVVRSFVRDWKNPRRSEVALRLGILAAAIAVAVNVVLFGLKLGFGLAIGSLALIADSLDTLGDILLDSTALVALTVSLKAPDPEHPYGHERAEEIASLAVATVLVLLGVEFGFEAGRRLITGNVSTEFAWAAVAAALVSVVGKLGISLFSHHIAEYTGSRLVRASAWHNMTDVFSGLLAAGAVLLRRYGYPDADPILAVVIALLIIGVGVRIFRSSADVLLGRGPSAKLREEIHQVACRQPGVLSCSDIEVHFYGRKKRISLRVQVADTMTLSEAHDVAERVQKELLGLHADWEPVVHVDPVRRVPAAQPS